MKVPAENILSTSGKGLRMALTLLDYGRVGFGSLCAAVGRVALQMTVEYANSRRQFGRPIAEFELVQKKLARMAQAVYAIEAMTDATVSMMDDGLEDCVLETAMVKVYCSEALWQVVDDAFQVHGGAAYFTDRPLEQMLRDVRILRVVEGANEVLLSFIALVGMREQGKRLQDIATLLKTHRLRGIQAACGFAFSELAASLRTPRIALRHAVLHPYAGRLARYIRRFRNTVSAAMFRHREQLLERQLVQEPLANAAIELFAYAAVLHRLDRQSARNEWQHRIGMAFLDASAARIRRHLACVRDDHESTRRAAAAVLEDAKPVQVTVERSPLRQEQAKELATP